MVDPRHLRIVPMTDVEAKPPPVCECGKTMWFHGSLTGWGCPNHANSKLVCAQPTPNTRCCCCDSRPLSESELAKFAHHTSGRVAYVCVACLEEFSPDVIAQRIEGSVVVPPSV